MFSSDPATHLTQHSPRLPLTLSAQLVCPVPPSLAPSSCSPRSYSLNVYLFSECGCRCTMDGGGSHRPTYGDQVSFCHVGPQDIRLSSKPLYPLELSCWPSGPIFHLPRTPQRLEEGAIDIHITLREFVLSCKLLGAQNEMGAARKVPAPARQSHRPGQKTQTRGYGHD